MTKEGIAYLSGVVLLGLSYAPLEVTTGGGIWFFLTAIGYLVLLRLIGYGIAKRWPDRMEEWNE